MGMDIGKASVRPGLWIARSPRCGYSGVSSGRLITVVLVEGDGRGGLARAGERSTCQGRLSRQRRLRQSILAKLAETILRSIVGNSPPSPGNVHHKPRD